jgi:hypothetical protein
MHKLFINVFNNTVYQSFAFLWILSFYVIRENDVRQKYPSRKCASWSSWIILDEIVTYLREYIQGMKTKLICHLDKVDAFDWWDRKSKNIVIISAITNEMIYYSIRRNLKHISVIICILSVREFFTPYIVTFHDFEFIHNRLKKQAFRFSVEIIWKIR